ncbi:hypothetical protein DPEC_G00271070 [Dallia pectoralis]|uniref:Uncharacterized protein n=1 Tax=Dallia pectoralis TaxID=75939 RepID=A0ACC2FPK1_DALPE|nr:hypothetical protein DPEC_G00271070 [Dallia pectoralis]
MSFAFGSAPASTSIFGSSAVKNEKLSRKEPDENVPKTSEGVSGRPEPWQSKLESPWRKLLWTDDRRQTLMDLISSYKPVCKEETQARVLLLGPVGAGKSSFISSVQSAFKGRVTNRAMVGSSSASFTKKLQLYKINGQNPEEPTALVLCDVMGLGDADPTGLTIHDTLAVIGGHAPEGHKFSAKRPLRLDTMGYVKKPLLQDKIHCVVFVLDASKLSSYTKGLTATFQQLRKHISDLGVHQVALLTHVDEVCLETAHDVTQVYQSRIIQQMMTKAGVLLGMSTSYIVPVKNYSSELEVEENTDILLLSAVDHILHFSFSSIQFTGRIVR